MFKHLRDGMSPIAYAAADAARGDATSVSVDTLLADAIKKLDALGTRMDALETTTKNPIKGDAAKKADDDDDDKKRRDDDDDDDKKRRDDGTTTPKNKIIDSAKKADDDDDKKRRDDDGELEIKHKGKGELKDDKRRSDDDDDDRRKDSRKRSDDDDDDRRDDKKRSDARKRSDDDDDDRRKDSRKRSDDDDDDRKDSARADSGHISPELLARLAKLEQMVKPMTDEEHAAFAECQARADSVFNGFGKRAPRPLEGESLTDYRVRLATTLKPYSKIWSKAKLSQMPAENLDIAEAQIYADAIEAAKNPVDLGEGELRAVTEVDQTTGLRTTKFYGKESFIKDFVHPSRRVVRIRTDRGAA